MQQHVLAGSGRLLCVVILWAATIGVARPGEPEPALQSLLEQTAADVELAAYANFREHILRLVGTRPADARPLAVNPYVRDILNAGDGLAVELAREDVFDFFDACARDQLTILRAMALVARAVHSTGVALFFNGKDARDAVDQLHLSVGLAVPMRHLLLFAYVPSHDPTSPDVRCRFVGIYGAAYEHRFAKEVLDATLKIGTGRTAPYLSPWDRDASIATAHIVEGTLIYGDGGVGYTNITGIGGRKHGLLGTLQRVLFFLPDGINGMVVREGDLYVRAVLDQQVDGFEQSLRYAVHPRSGYLANPSTLPISPSEDPGDRPK